MVIYIPHGWCSNHSHSPSTTIIWRKQSQNVRNGCQYNYNVFLEVLWRFTNLWPCPHNQRLYEWIAEVINSYGRIIWSSVGRQISGISREATTHNTKKQILVRDLRGRAYISSSITSRSRAKTKLIL
jgi:hypothetical protein